MYYRKVKLKTPDACENCGCHIPAGKHAIKTYEHQDDSEDKFMSVYCTQRCRREAE